MAVVLIFFVTDVIVSFKIISNIKRESSQTFKDVTEQTTEEIKKVLREKSIFNRRLLNSFPHLKFILKKKKTYK